jgi:NAD(P)-dependent dehydrogenase (short-subunit alcohol dehydrogenase family)
MNMTGAYAIYPSIAQKIVVVTGGATGIGAEMVRQFAAQGARVHVLDVDETSGSALADELNHEAKHATVSFTRCDVTDCAALRSAIEAIGSDNGRIDTLINNAANDTRHDWRELTPEAWDACMNVNLRHHFFAAQAAYPYLCKAGGGSIICLGSIAWLNGTTEMVGYTTAKAGIHGLVRTLAKLLGPDHIRVNALLPGWTMTERQRRLWVDAAAEKTIAASQSLPRLLEASDVARLALFLASDDARMCTKQVYVVDGGWV